MKNIILIFTTIFISLNSLSIYSKVNEEIFRAMKDEIDRSMTELKLDKLEKPYYIEYILEISSPVTIQSYLGSVVEINNNKQAKVTVQVRVGDYQFDNTNFFDIGLGFFGSSDDEEGFKNRRIALQPDYNSLRRELWLATDAAYKREAEIFSKKVATLQNKIRRDSTLDFLKVKPETNIFENEVPKFDINFFTDIVNSASKIFIEYPEIATSSAIVEYATSEFYYFNSEGMKSYFNEYHTNIEVVATAQASDGMPLGNYYRTMSNNPDKIAKKDEILKEVKKLADLLKKQTEIKAEFDDYSGPVLFVDNAAGQVFASQFAPNLVTQREPLSEGGFSTGNDNGAFQTKIGGRVLPEFMTLKAIPNQKELNGKELVGHFKIDSEGIKPSDFTIVENGFLKELFSSRVPTKRVKVSNGHKREGGTMFSNIAFEVQKEKAVSYDSLKNKLIELCKMRELPYGIIIKNVMDRNIMYTSLFRQNPGLFKFSTEQGKLMITEAYKVYPDGREELIRGLDGKSFTSRSFKDILLSGNENKVMNYLASAVISPFVTGGSRFIYCSIISPDLLFEDGELVAPEGNYDKPPFLPNPLSKKNGK
jgi:hypothetical protein